MARDGRHSPRTCGPITREALRKMKVGKAVGLNGIPVEIWKTLGGEGLDWLEDLFSVIFETAMIPQNWR